MKFRHEYKHCINNADIYCLRSRLRVVMNYDSNCGDDGTYVVKSLYFDNFYDKALREKIDGVNKREKFRIRYYGNDTSFIRLEKKSKVNGLCFKESVPLTKEQCTDILCGNREFMAESENSLMREFYAKMKYELLRPKCIVAYTREAYVYPLGNVRVTFDTNIGVSYNTANFLNADLQFMKTDKSSILEVKWDEYLPQLIRDCVQLKGRKSSAFSKYSASRIY